MKTEERAHLCFAAPQKTPSRRRKALRPNRQNLRLAEHFDNLHTSQEDELPEYFFFKAISPFCPSVYTHSNGVAQGERERISVAPS